MGETLIPWVKERLSFTVYFVAHEVLLKGLPQKTPPKLLYVLPNPRLHVLHFSPLKITAWFVGVSLLKTSCLVPTSLSSCFESLSIMEEHGLTHAERQLFFGLLNDPLAEAGGGTNWEAEDLGFATRIQHRTFKSQIVKRIQM